jgi:hypothetical protein
MRWLVLAVVLSGCAPTFDGGNERTVIIGNVDGMNDGKALMMADEHCRKFGRIARVAATVDFRAEVTRDFH